MIKMFLEDVGRVSLCFPCSEEQEKERETVRNKIKIKLIDEEEKND